MLIKRYERKQSYCGKLSVSLPVASLLSLILHEIETQRRPITNSPLLSQIKSNQLKVNHSEGSVLCSKTYENLFSQDCKQHLNKLKHHILFKHKEQNDQINLKCRFVAVCPLDIFLLLIESKKVIFI